jgi:hypothetical protein
VLIYLAYLIGLIEPRTAATLPRFGQKLVLRILGLLGMSQNKQHLSATICISIFDRPNRDLLSISRLTSIGRSVQTLMLPSSTRDATCAQKGELADDDCPRQTVLSTTAQGTEQA